MNRFLSSLMIALALLLPASFSRAAEESPAAAGHAAEGHPEIDERLVPIPPSHDTLVSAVWVIIIFLVMLAILYPTAWKNVLAGLKAREERIRADIADAEASRKKAEQSLAEYNQKLATAEQQMRDILSKAAADAEKLATQMKMTAQQEVEEIKERATKDIDAARKAALSDIYAQAAELSTSIAAKILRRNINADDQRDLVNSSIQQFSTSGKV